MAIGNQDYTYSKKDLDEVGILPWFSYSVTLPVEPIPTPSERSPLRTERLVVRPFVESDLESLHQLRSDADLQRHSWARGRSDKDICETRESLQRLQAPDGPEHWYWGAFLASTGELIGEGGLFDTMGNSRSGWPEVDILIAPAHQRQGYGTEFYTAVMESWWALPREYRRRQLHPFVRPGKEPGDRQIDCVVHSWELENTAADGFFGKVLKGQGEVELKGVFEDHDYREARELRLTKFVGLTLPNPRPLVDIREEDSEEEDEDIEEGLELEEEDSFETDES